MLKIYKRITSLSKSAFEFILKRRVHAGKEDASRLAERKGLTKMERPQGNLIWLHAASVGEAQSALVLINTLIQKHSSSKILVTTGTTTSAQLMQQKLPEGAFHQYYPLDHPKWVKQFLDHWKPDIIFWMESELWPNMISEIKSRNIPTALVNARLSERSYKRWKLFSQSAEHLLSAFSIIFTQTEQDKHYYTELNAKNLLVSDNIKYSATVLPYDETDYEKLQKAVHDRPIWLYASTHDGEEHLACEIHRALRQNHPNLLTIIVPRHPHRGSEIHSICENAGLDALTRSDLKRIPDSDTDIYIADTLGEMGLFYRLSPVVCVGRSFSNDGGGGHNPIEPAQLGCAVLCGPHVQNLQDIYNDMLEQHGCIQVNNKDVFISTLSELLSNKDRLSTLQEQGRQFATHKAGVIDTVMEHLTPYLEKALKEA